MSFLVNIFKKGFIAQSTIDAVIAFVLILRVEFPGVKLSVMFNKFLKLCYFIFIWEININMPSCRYLVETQ